MTENWNSYLILNYEIYLTKKTLYQKYNHEVFVEIGCYTYTYINIKLKFWIYKSINFSDV